MRWKKMTCNVVTGTTKASGVQDARDGSTVSIEDSQWIYYTLIYKIILSSCYVWIVPEDLQEIISNQKSAKTVNSR